VRICDRKYDLETSMLEIYRCRGTKQKDKANDSTIRFDHSYRMDAVRQKKLRWLARERSPMANNAIPSLLGRLSAE